jgi:FPC/CPF motif-containing protein YcgG
VNKTLRGFLDELRRVARLVFPKAALDYTILRLTHLSLRITINEETQRTDYALIHKGRRVYGVDNLKGWHRHPFQAVEQHFPCPEPSVQEVFKKMKVIVEAL